MFTLYLILALIYFVVNYTLAFIPQAAAKINLLVWLLQDHGGESMVYFMAGLLVYRHCLVEKSREGRDGKENFGANCQNITFR